MNELPRLKIAFFNPTISGRGGAETVLAGTISDLQAANYDVRLYIFGGSKDKAWLRDVARWSEIGQPSYPRLLRLLSYFVGAIYVFLRWRPDVVVACDPTTVRLAALARRMTGLRKTPILSSLFCSALQLQQNGQLSKADAHLCTCKERADEMEQFAKGSPLHGNGSPQVFTVYSGTSNLQLPPIARSNIPVFLYVGRVMDGSQKRTNDLLSAAAHLRGRFQIKVLGDGHPDDMAKLYALTESLGLGEVVEWLGWSINPWASPPPSTVLVQPSAYEGYSMVMIEALALGLPVVASRFGGISAEAIIPNVNGWLYPVADIDSLARILQAIIDTPEIVPHVDVVRRSAMRFSREQMVQDFVAAITSVKRQREIYVSRNPFRPAA